MDTRGRLRRFPATESPNTISTRPFRWGFIVTLGVLSAALLAIALVGLKSVVLSVFIAVFVALGLDPLIRWFQRRGMKRAWAIVTVIVLFILVVASFVLILIPPVIGQAVALIGNIPSFVADLRDANWFETINEQSGGVASTIAQNIGSFLTNPNVWATIGGGALQFGAAVIDGVSTSVFVVVLSIYFIATLDQSKQACYLLIPASKRRTIVEYAERIMASVGKYLSGMVVLAFINAVFSTILLYAVGVPYALIFGVIALFVTLIPLIGTVLTTTLMTIVSFFVSPTAGIIVLIVMLAYMQLEAYVLTPKVMGKAVQVPGTIVLISALAGGTLLGLLGALVAIPISAGILMIIREVVIPERART